ncbi:Serine/threonine-protein kinase pats1 [Melia azedarach]|uniref:Serine/threonine-protein kinase pats1 n=1 Tax=Melia azedarach TaxID=155640 RepID=A0ACC1YKQ6_MELAZ|nr:Serine/threonine-protein kinase pats1 [Melia azedarach]
MVFNSVIVLTVAHVSADAWQQISCIPTTEQISSEQLLDLVCCFPLQQLGRFALCLWTFLCLPPPDSFYSYSYYDSSSEEEDSDYHDHGRRVQFDGGSSSSSGGVVDLGDNYYYHSHSD